MHGVTNLRTYYFIVNLTGKGEVGNVHKVGDRNGMEEEKQDMLEGQNSRLLGN